MLASLADAPLDDPQLVYEPKYDGIRAIAEIGPRGVRLWSRLGNEKTNQFPEIAAALQQWAGRLPKPLVLDGEIVALDAKGEPAGFQQLQGRIHLHDPGLRVSKASPSRPSDTSRPSSSSVAFIAFDLLQEGSKSFLDRPLIERRAKLERLFGRRRPTAIIRLSSIARGNGRALYREALEHGWEGLIAKHAASLYKPGKRTPDWRKIKLVHEQEFVVGGWTEPRQTRSYFGALLLGVYDDGRLVYAGHTGTGFNERELARVMKLLEPLETPQCPFAERPKTNERPHWVRPELVAQVKFTEWTSDGKLRHPVYLGLRDDKRPSEVRREGAVDVRRSAADGRRSARTTNPGPRTSNAARRAPNLEPRTPNDEPRTTNLIDQLTALEKARRDGVLVLPDGDTLAVTNLHKVFWPTPKLTKGDLFRYYVRVAPALLPAIADRPLVMKRFPNGVTAQPFYQHRAPEVPAGVRSEVVTVAETRAHIIGGTLKTLLYTTQLAAISQDPWFSRLPHPEHADCAAFDLDPSEGVPFATVLDVARWIRDELATLGARGVPKTSGADGLHIYIPLPAGTPYEAALLYCQIVATIVAQKHPKLATTERSVRARGKRVYIDCFQNILGKTLASAYSARANPHGGVSTPLSWKEVEAGVDRRDFTIETVPARIDEVGDLWAALRKTQPVDLTKVTRYATR
jgi:bifunctional non-homologous end joining protein LigD